MIDGYSPIVQTLLGTLFTWSLTAAGAGLVFVFNSTQRKILDGSLGFAAGVMIAASFWSLLKPAIEIAEQSGLYGNNGEFVLIPVVIGFMLGAVFVYCTDILLPFLGVKSPVLWTEKKLEVNGSCTSSINVDYAECTPLIPHSGSLHRRRCSSTSQAALEVIGQENNFHICWKRILLLIFAITVHNIPEGLAVGVGFGAVNKTRSATFENARNLAIGIGIQNFPEGLAVSLPLCGAGVSPWKSFWYGQLSGAVEPIAGLLGCLAVTLAEPALPYALAFAAGAMIYVVIDDIIPEAQTEGNGKLASLTSICGFLVMMALDVGLG